MSQNETVNKSIRSEEWFYIQDEIFTSGHNKYGRAEASITADSCFAGKQVQELRESNTWELAYVMPVSNKDAVRIMVHEMGDF